MTSGGRQGSGEEFDSALLDNGGGECDQTSDHCSGCGWKRRLCQGNISSHLTHHTNLVVGELNNIK